MSADLDVYLPRSSMPSPARWAEAIVQAGYPAELDTDFDVDHLAGFLPCRFHGKPSGFEYYSRALTEQDCMRLGVLARFDYRVNLCVHSGLEWATAAVAAGILCWLGRGVLCDPQVGVEYQADEVLAWVDRHLARTGSGEGNPAE